MLPEDTYVAQTFDIAYRAWAFASKPRIDAQEEQYKKLAEGRVSRRWASKIAGNLMSALNYKEYGMGKKKGGKGKGGKGC